MSNITKKVLISGVLMGLSGVALALDRMPSKANTSVYIISPVSGETVSSPVKVQFGLIGMGVAPAGVDRAGTGHHHLIIDGNINKIPKNVPIGAQAKHFGGGQTETTLILTKGEHTLQLLLADKFHIPHKPVVNSPIVKIIVK